MFNIHNTKSAREPKLFNFFPDAQKQLNKYCIEQVNEGTISCESVATHLRNVIIPKCYKDLCDNAAEKHDLPSYKELFWMQIIYIWYLDTNPASLDLD